VINATEESKQSELHTTGEVLDRLHRLGLCVTPDMIADDTAAHYLPERKTAYRGRDGASGLWEPWMERRAKRLYRLRALHRRTGHGPTGDLLRLFLLFGDAWGWEHVRDTCIKGYRLNIRGATKGVANRVRGQELTLDNLWMFAEDIAEDQYRPQTPNAAQVDRVGMTLALLKCGIVPDGRMGTLERFVDDFMPADADPEELQRYKNTAPLMWSMLNLGEVEAIEVLNGELNDRVLKRGIYNFRTFMLHVRYGFRKKVFTGKERPPSTNPLTAFGAAKHFRFQEAFRKMPMRMTPAQMVGAQFAQALVIAHGEEQLAKMSEFFDRWLAYFLKSEACARWLEQMEREVNQHKN
jgi:hypothetical protein